MLNRISVSLVSAMLVFHVSWTVAQRSGACPPATDKKAKAYFEKALAARKSGKDLQVVKDWCDKAVEADTAFAEPMVLLGNAAYAKKDSRVMSEAYERAIAICPDVNPEIYFRLGTYYFDRKKYDDAIRAFQTMAEFSTVKESMAQQAALLSARASLLKNPVPFDPKPVRQISTPDPEYLAAISADNDLCLFTRRYEMNTKSSLTPVSVEKFMMARRQADGTYEKGEPMPLPFNSRNTNNEGGPSISIDNQHLYFTVNRNGNFDLYYSDYIKDQWGPITNLGLQVNDSVQWDSQPSISSDNKTLYFASYRDSVFGTSDIFVTKKKNGTWSAPEKLSSAINTNGNEKAPFIHPDNQTLYFSSDSLPGMGGFDIFFSKKDSKGNWGKPVNLGYPINTDGDEVGFFVSTDGKTGYFASNKYGGAGGYDLYSFDLYAGARPEKVLMVSGSLRNEQNEIPYAAKIELKNITSQEINHVEYDTLTGRFASVVLFDNDYIMTVKKDSSAFTSRYFARSDTLNDKPVKVEFDVRKIELGNAYTLHDILFATDSYVLTDVSKRVIEDFAEFLETNPRVKVAIHGHTDNEGDPGSNLALSNNRAKAVYNYLIELKINPARLSYKGFGQTKPVAANLSPEGKAKNRRTEFVIISK